MDPELKSLLRTANFADREKVQLNKRLFIYLFFLFSAIVFWYLNALSKTYVAQTHYTVFYNNFPKGKVLVSELPVQLDLDVRGYGFHILRYKIISLFKPIHINLTEFQPNFKQKNNQFDYFLLTRNMLEKLNSNFNGIQITRIKPDTLFFSFTDVFDKKIPIKPIMDLEFEKSYMLNGAVRVLPDCLEVSGPKVNIDTLSYIYTRKAHIEKIKDTVIYTVELLPLKHFIFPLSKVKLFIPTEKFTEMVFNIPLETENVPEGLDLKTFPRTVSVSCMIAVSNYNKVSPFMFRAIVDYNSISTSNMTGLKVNLVKYPPDISNIKVRPKNVEYIIEK